jgi:hypothetical protein
MALTGRESGRDLGIDRVLLPVDAVSVDLEQHGHIVTEPPGDLDGGTPLFSQERRRDMPQVVGPALTASGSFSR